MMKQGFVLLLLVAVSLGCRARKHHTYDEYQVFGDESIVTQDVLTTIMPQSNSTITSISGIVVEKTNRLPMLGTLIFLMIGDEHTQCGTITNEKGEYTLLMPPGKYTLKAECIGYMNLSYEISLSEGEQRRIDIAMGQQYQYMN